MIDAHAARFTGTARYIGNHPELGYEEFKACSRLAREFEHFGFAVQTGLLGMETAFLAEYRASRPGPVAALFCEYDALPEIGHACGHHLISAMSLAAAAGLKSVLEETGGVIRVYGTPAEETAGAKVPMADKGLFDDVDFALMAHPFHAFETPGTSLALDAVQFEFFGKAAHAAASPHEGINALDAVIQLFNAVNALRQQMESHARVHGIIVEGGKAANIIPDYAAARFYIRAANRPYTSMLTGRVRRCAEGAALQTGCQWKESYYEHSYDELLTNETLSEVYLNNLRALGVPPEEIRPGQDHGSLDLGNVSRRCPVIHPFVKVIDEPHPLHTREFRDAAMTGRAMELMLLSGKALAFTAYDVLADPQLLRRIRKEFESRLR
jgi:amidohydrolase